MREFQLSRKEENWLEAMVGPKGVWREAHEFQMRFMTQQGLLPEHTLLDLGCGVLRGGLLFADYLKTGHYFGVDIREEAIMVSQKLIDGFGLGEKAPKLLVSDSFGVELNQKFNFVFAFQVLYHLTDELAEEAFTAISQLIDEKGVAFANINTRFGNKDGSDGKWLEFPFVKRPRSFYQDLAQQHGLIAEYIGELHEFGYTRKVAGTHNEMLRIVRKA